MSDFSVIPQAAIDHLLANPGTDTQFDSVFGKGRAAEVIASRHPVPEPAADDDDWSLLGEATRAIVGGARDAAVETGNFAKWVGDSLADTIWGEGNDIYYTDDGWQVLPRAEIAQRDDVGGFQQAVGGEAPVFGTDGATTLPEVGENRTIIGGMGRGIVQFATGYVTFSRLTRLQGLKGAFVTGAITDAVVFNPNDPNVTRLLEEFGVDTGVFGEVLATNPDDPEFINRLRNAAEGVLAGGIVEAIGWGIRAARATKAGDTRAAQAFTEKQAAALKELDDEIARTAVTVGDDARQSLDLSKEVFDRIERGEGPWGAKPDAPRVDADGQIALDLGDAPRAAPIEGAAETPNRIFLTPERTEKIRLQAALAAGAPRSAKQAGLSFRSLTTVTDFEDVLDEIAGARAVLADEFAKIKGGDVQRWATVKAQAAAQLRQMAAMTGEDPEALVRRFMSTGSGDVTKLAAEVHARSRYLLTVEQELKEMARAITTGVMDPKRFPGIRDMDHMRLAFTQRREVAANLLAGQDALRSNVARAMNAMKIAVKGDEQLRTMLKDPSVFRDVDAAAQAVADPANAGKSAVKVIDETLGAIHGYMDRINTFRINALLSGPGTHEVNFISNAINSFVIPAEQALGGIATGDFRAVSHATRQLQGYSAGLLDSIQAALRAGWWDEAVLDAVTKIEDDALSSAVTGIKAVDAAIKLPSRALMTMDEFFKQSQYRGRIFADAHSEATRNGLTGTAKTDFIKKYLRESYDESGRALRGDALLQARRATFTEPLEGGLAGALQMLAIKHPMIRFIVPFVRTPINILSQTFQHVPIAGALSKRWKADIAAGGVRRAQAIGRWIVGSGLMSAAGYLAANGMITGAGPSDPRIRKVWLQNNQPYAFRLENEDGTTTWVSYARLEPLSNIFSVSADMVEIANDPYNEASTRPMAEALFMAIMENSVNKTFTQGIYDAMAIMVSSRQYEREAALRNMLASFVPSALNQLNGDEVLRETRTVADAFMARSWRYNEVDPKRNVLGEPIVRRLPKNDPLGLTIKDKREHDAVLAEVTRVAVLNQSVADNPARRLPGPSRIDLATIPYAEGQSLYDRWIELTGEVEIGGLTLREKLAETIKSRSYQTAPDGFIGATSGTKGAIIRRIISAYREKAKSELPELVKLIQSERRGGGTLLREQVKSNRELFPLSNAPERVLRRRTFDDLLGR